MEEDDLEILSSRASEEANSSDEDFVESDANNTVPSRMSFPMARLFPLRRLVDVPGDFSPEVG